MSFTRYLLVANPSAQSGRARRWIRRAMRELRRHGMTVTLLETQPHGKTISLVTSALDKDDHECVISLGGDGTFHEVATGILQASRPVPMAMLPAGTANDQGLSFGIARGNIRRNVETIVRNHLTPFDVGRIERLDSDGTSTHSSYFFDSCGWGLQPDILANRNRQRTVIGKIPLLRQLYRDKAVYITASLGKLLESYAKVTKFSAEITVDGEARRLKGLTDLIISNTAIYAGSWVLDRTSRPDDGLLELVPMQGRRDWASKAIRDLAVMPLWQEQLDPLGVTHSQSVRGSSFEIELFHPERSEVTAQVDGEEWQGGSRYRVGVTQGALQLVTRHDFIAPWTPNDEGEEPRTGD